MNISIFGFGYVGSTVGECLAQQGHKILPVDPKLTGRHEPDEAIQNSDLSFVCVGTPSLPSGAIDLSQIKTVAEQIGTALRSKSGGHTIAIKSTVIPGTCESVIIPIVEAASGKRHGEGFALCSNPEFLRQASAVRDFFNPAITVIGAEKPEHAAPLLEIYRGLPGELFVTSLRTAELVKYVANTWHALKVAFANEIGRVSERLELDPCEVYKIFVADRKLNISPLYLQSGGPFGGACLPKDVNALNHLASELHLILPLLSSIMASNEIQQSLSDMTAQGASVGL